MTSIFTSVNWKWCLGRSKSPYSLYRYEERPTPKTYIGQQKARAFKLMYDQNSNQTDLQHDREVRDGIAVEFSNTATLPQETKIAKTMGWYFDQQDLASFHWDNLKSGTENMVERKLEKKDRFRWIKENEGHLYGIDRLWAIRGYFIGPDEDNAPPCITVLCAYEDVARFLVDVIHSKLHLHEGWGATRLPGVKVLRLGSDSESIDKPDNPGQNSVDREAERDLIRIDIGSQDTHSIPTMSNEDLSSWAQQRHRCGIQVEIVEDSNVVAKATVGGLITVGDEVYGLTVGHLFSPSETQDGGESRILSAKKTSTLNSWKTGQACGMGFDWALIRIPGLKKHNVQSWMDVNLVQTVSGEFRPVLIALEEPAPFTRVVLATPRSTHCLRGILVGPGAIMNIPGAPTPYNTWVCRMELPWLIKNGDSGSWLLDAGNGMLLGVLVAGCPELHEAYIIPAHDIIDDIKRKYSDDDPDLSVNLPSCHHLPKASQIDLHWHINEYGSLLKSLENVNFADELKDLEDRIRNWGFKVDSFTDISPSSYILRDEKSQWTSSLAILPYENLMRRQRHKSDDFWDMLRNATHMSPLRHYNSLNKKFMTYHAQDHSPYNDMLILSWRCLILGLSNLSRTADVHQLSKARKSKYSPVMKEEASLMTHIISPDYHGPRSPWTMNFTVKFVVNPDSLSTWSSNYGFARAQEATRPYYPIRRGRTDWPPLDRLTATELLGGLHQDLQKLIVGFRRNFEISLSETKMPDSPFVTRGLKTDSDMVVFAVKLIVPGNEFLVIIPPPSVGPNTFKEYGIPGNSYPKYYSSDDSVEYSSFRLPYILTDRVPDEENLRLLLSTHLHIDTNALKECRKVHLRREHSRIYLKEYDRFVDFVIYEGRIENKSFDGEHSPTGWIMKGADEEMARSYLLPPFSAILDV